MVNTDQNRSPQAPRSTKLFYGIGQYADGIILDSVSLFLIFYYNQIHGLKGSLAGLAMLLALVTDALSDPLIGALSDRTRTRWGRRHPYMYAAAIPVPLCFYLLFVPPEGLGQWALFAWMAAFNILARQGMTLFMTPYFALGAELSTDFEERNTIVAIRTMFQRMGAAMAWILGLVVYMRPTEEFPNGQFNADAYPPYALTVAALVFSSMVISAMGTHSFIPRLPKRKTETASSGKGNRGIVANIVNDMREAWSIKSFQILIMSNMIGFVGWGLMGTINLHMWTYFWQASTHLLFLFGLLFFGGIFLGLWYWTNVANRTDKKPVYVKGMAGFIVCVSVPIFCKSIGLYPPRDSPFYLPILFFISGAMGGFCISSPMVTGHSMMADVTDEDQLKHGQRREGISFGAMTFIAKASVGVGAQISGFLLDLVGLDPGSDPTDVAPTVARNLGLSYAFTLAVIIGLALLILSRYSLDRTRHAEIRVALEARK